MHNLVEKQEDIKKIIEHFGYFAQLDKLQEECKEFLKANTIDEIYDECADVLLVTLQLYLSDQKIKDRVNYKIERTLDRIKSGYYDNK